MVRNVNDSSLRNTQESNWPAVFNTARATKAKEGPWNCHKSKTINTDASEM